MEQGQDLGRAAADVLMRLGGGLAARLPGGTGMRHRLERAGLVLAPDRQPLLGTKRVGLLDQLFLAGASGSLTRTRPDLRRRSAAPVPHQVRLFCQLRPASCRVRAMVNRLTRGRPSGAWRSAFCSRLSDQVALLLMSPIADAWPAAMMRAHGSQPFAVEAADPSGDGLIVVAPDPMGSSGVAGALGNGQQGAGAVDLGDGGTLRAAQAGELYALLRGERAQGIF